MFKSLHLKFLVMLVLITALLVLASPVQAASPVVEKDGECFTIQNATYCWSTQLITSPSGTRSFIERSSVTYITETGQLVTERNFAHSVFDKDGNLIVAVEH